MTLTDPRPISSPSQERMGASVRSAKTVFQTEWFSIVEEQIADQAAYANKPYYTLQRSDGVIVLAITRARQIILVRQYRPAIHQYTLELPCGSLEAHEEPCAAAARELYEETGYRCDRLTGLGVGRIMLDRLRSREFLFFGEGAQRDPCFKSQEPIEVILIQSAELKERVMAGQLEQLATLGILLLAQWKCGYSFGETSVTESNLP